MSATYSVGDLPVFARANSDASDGYVVYGDPGLSYRLWLIGQMAPHSVDPVDAIRYADAIIKLLDTEKGN